MLFDNLYDLVDYNNELDKVKEDIVFETQDIQIISANEIMIHNKIYEINKFLIQQIFKRMANATNQKDYNFGATIVNYLMEFPNIREKALFQHLTEFNNKFPSIGWLGRLNNNRLRAILSNNYSILNNSSILEHLVKNVLPDYNLRILNDTTCNSDGFVLKLLLDEYDSDGLGLGIAVSNSELGIGAVTFYGLLKRHSCDNSVITSGNIRYYHRGNIYQRLEDTLPQISEQLRNARVLRNKFKELNTIVLDKEKLDYMITKFVKKHSLSDKIKEQMFIGTENKSTLQSFINGITYAAKSIVDANKRLEIEHIAGDNIMNNPINVIKNYGE